jgi:hypothetical protein
MAAVAASAAVAGTSYGIVSTEGAKSDAKKIAEKQLAAAVQMEQEQTAERAREFDIAAKEAARQTDLAAAFNAVTSQTAQTDAATRAAVATKTTPAGGNATLYLAAGLAAAVILARLKKG